MKNKIISSVIVLLLAILISATAFASLGVSSPSDLALKPGDDPADFAFQVQSTPGHGDVMCVATVNENSMLEINVENGNEIILLDAPPNKVDVYGTVALADNAIIDEDYSAQICVTCEKLIGGEAGVSTKTVYCAQSVDVHAVREIKRENPVVRSPPKKFFWGKIIVGLIILFVLAIIFWYHYKNKHHHEGKFHLGTAKLKDIKPPIAAAKKKKPAKKKKAKKKKSIGKKK